MTPPGGNSKPEIQTCDISPPTSVDSATVVQKGGLNSLLKIVIKAKVISENYQITGSTIE